MTGSQSRPNTSSPFPPGPAALSSPEALNTPVTCPPTPPFPPPSTSPNPFHRSHHRRKPAGASEPGSQKLSPKQKLLR
ncbi:hypothetical protein BST61_g542 [Cercospora zeina]